MPTRLSPRGPPARGPSTKKGRRHVKPVKVARRIFDALERHYPDADTELDYRTPFELLVATILSAQSTDQRVNMVTPELFRRYPDARALADAAPADVEPLILS